MNDGNHKQLPQYQCHKKVFALKISAVVPAANGRPCEPNEETDGTAVLHFSDEGYSPIFTEREYMKKHNPQAGGFYVVYDDGYKSFSPAKAFEDGYTRI